MGLLFMLFLWVMLSQSVLIPVTSCNCYPPPSAGGVPIYGTSPPAHIGGGGGGGKNNSGPPSASPSHKRGGSYPKPPSHSNGGVSGKPPSVPIPPVAPLPPATTPTPLNPGNCDFWRTHPALMWGLVGYWSTIGGLFGAPISPVFGELTLKQALESTRRDGYGDLLREGTASLLNTFANVKFPFTTQQIREKFSAAALGSEETAALQAREFKLANEGHLV